VLVSRPWYCRYDDDGIEHDVHWFRAGLRRLYVEVGKWGIDARLGPARLSVFLDHSDDDDPPTT
jgi:hypothetical protein